MTQEEKCLDYLFDSNEDVRVADQPDAGSKLETQSVATEESSIQGYSDVAEGGLDENHK